MIILNLDSALANVGDTQKNRLIDQAILRIAVSDTSGPLTILEINNLIIQINGKVGLLRDKTKRGVITDAFSKKDAIRLSRILGIENELDLLALQVREIQDRNASIMASFFEQLANEVEKYSTAINRSTNELKKINRRIAASEIKSPVTGYVSTVEVTTPGEVISTGMVLATIVPESDELVIEAKLAPKDVNFITINQKANIVLTAYDATVYGKIKGKVSKIGINTLEDPATGETYYPITILAEDKSFDQRPNEVAEFVPGMEASIELVGEKRSIAQYIMKPFKKFQLEAFTDR